MTKEELIGRKFENTKKGEYSGVFQIVEIKYPSICYRRLDTGSHYYITLDEWDNNIRTNWWKLLPQETMLDYKQVDPKTITFDFTNTKIKVNNKDETKWLYGVGINNGYKPLFQIQSKARNLFFWKDSYLICEGNYEDFIQSMFKEITIQDILNMNDKIEVGDIVEIVSSNGSPLEVGSHHTVSSVLGNSIYIRNFVFTNNETTKLLKLVSKASKQEIIGYETVVDLPGIPKGSKSTDYNTSLNLQTYWTKYGPAYFKKSQLQDTRFFKPIYKPKEVVVEISGGRKVTIKDGEVLLDSQGKIKTTDVEHLLDYVYTEKKVVSSSFGVRPGTIFIGCQEFTKEDIEKVYQAIQTK